jgi:hypothetical protein
MPLLFDALVEDMDVRAGIVNLLARKKAGDESDRSSKDKYSASSLTEPDLR